MENFTCEIFHGNSMGFHVKYCMEFPWDIKPGELFCRIAQTTKK